MIIYKKYIYSTIHTRRRRRRIIIIKTRAYIKFSQKHTHTLTLIKIRTHILE